MSGASVPTPSDNVYFDANSFTLTGQTVTVNVAANCLGMDWTGVLNTPTFAGNNALNLYGSLSLNAQMNCTYSSDFTFQSTAAVNVNFSGLSLVANIAFFGSGTFNLQNNITTTRNIQVLQGTVNTNNYNINCNAAFDIYFSGVKVLNLGSSVITCVWWEVESTVTNLTINPGTSTIIQTSGGTFDGFGKTYYNVELRGTSIIITGSNTFNTLTIAPGKTVKLTSGTTQTITSLVCNGTNANPSTLQSVTAASPAIIALPAGRYFIRHTSIKDITATGATSVTSIAGTNVSGNTGITFVTKFEMGRIKNDGSFNWYNTSTGTVTKISG